MKMISVFWAIGIVFFNSLVHISKEHVIDSQIVTRDKAVLQDNGETDKLTQDCMELCNKNDCMYLCPEPAKAVKRCATPLKSTRKVPCPNNQKAFLTMDDFDKAAGKSWNKLQLAREQYLGIKKELENDFVNKRNSIIKILQPLMSRKNSYNRDLLHRADLKPLRFKPKPTPNACDTSNHRNEPTSSKDLVKPIKTPSDGTQTIEREGSLVAFPEQTSGSHISTVNSQGLKRVLNNESQANKIVNDEVTNGDLIYPTAIATTNEPEHSETLSKKKEANEFENENLMKSTIGPALQKPELSEISSQKIVNDGVINGDLMNPTVITRTNEPEISKTHSKKIVVNEFINEDLLNPNVFAALNKPEISEIFSQEIVTDSVMNWDLMSPTVIPITNEPELLETLSKKKVADETFNGNFMNTSTAALNEPEILSQKTVAGGFINRDVISSTIMATANVPEFSESPSQDIEANEIINRDLSNPTIISAIHEPEDSEILSQKIVDNEYINGDSTNRAIVAAIDGLDLSEISSHKIMDGGVTNWVIMNPTVIPATTESEHSESLSKKVVADEFINGDIRNPTTVAAMQKPYVVEELSKDIVDNDIKIGDIMNPTKNETEILEAHSKKIFANEYINGDIINPTIISAIDKPDLSEILSHKTGDDGVINGDSMHPTVIATTYEPELSESHSKKEVANEFVNRGVINDSAINSTVVAAIHKPEDSEILSQKIVDNEYINGDSMNPTVIATTYKPELSESYSKKIVAKEFENGDLMNSNNVAAIHEPEVSEILSKKIVDSEYINGDSTNPTVIATTYEPELSESHSKKIVAKEFENGDITNSNIVAAIHEPECSEIVVKKIEDNDVKIGDLMNPTKNEPELLETLSKKIVADQSINWDFNNPAIMSTTDDPELSEILSEKIVAKGFINEDVTIPTTNIPSTNELELSEIISNEVVGNGHANGKMAKQNVIQMTKESELSDILLNKIVVDGFINGDAVKKPVTPQSLISDNFNCSCDDCNNFEKLPQDDRLTYDTTSSNGDTGSKSFKDDDPHLESTTSINEYHLSNPSISDLISLGKDESHFMPLEINNHLLSDDGHLNDTTLVPESKFERDTDGLKFIENNDFSKISSSTNFNYNKSVELEGNSASHDISNKNSRIMVKKIPIHKYILNLNDNSRNISYDRRDKNIQVGDVTTESVNLLNTALSDSQLKIQPKLIELMNHFQDVTEENEILTSKQESAYVQSILITEKPLPTSDTNISPSFFLENEYMSQQDYSEGKGLTTPEAGTTERNTFLSNDFQDKISYYDSVYTNKDYANSPSVSLITDAPISNGFEVTTAEIITEQSLPPDHLQQTVSKIKDRMKYLMETNKEKDGAFAVAKDNIPRIKTFKHNFVTDKNAKTNFHLGNLLRTKLPAFSEWLHNIPKFNPGSSVKNKKAPHDSSSSHTTDRAHIISFNDHESHHPKVPMHNQLSLPDINNTFISNPRAHVEKSGINASSQSEHLRSLMGEKFWEDSRESILEMLNDGYFKDQFISEKPMTTRNEIHDAQTDINSNLHLRETGVINVNQSFMNTENIKIPITKYNLMDDRILQDKKENRSSRQFVTESDFSNKHSPTIGQSLLAAPIHDSIIPENGTVINITSTETYPSSTENPFSSIGRIQNSMYSGEKNRTPLFNSTDGTNLNDYLAIYDHMIQTLETALETKEFIEKSINQSENILSQNINDENNLETVNKDIFSSNITLSQTKDVDNDDELQEKNISANKKSLFITRSIGENVTINKIHEEEETSKQLPYISKSLNNNSSDDNESEVNLDIKKTQKNFRDLVNNELNDREQHPIILKKREDDMSSCDDSECDCNPPSNSEIIGFQEPENLIPTDKTNLDGHYNSLIKLFSRNPESEMLGHDWNRHNIGCGDPYGSDNGMSEFYIPEYNTDQFDSDYEFISDEKTNEPPPDMSIFYPPYINNPSGGGKENIEDAKQSLNEKMLSVKEPLELQDSDLTLLERGKIAPSYNQDSKDIQEVIPADIMEIYEVPSFVTERNLVDSEKFPFEQEKDSTGLEYAFVNGQYVKNWKKIDITTENSEGSDVIRSKNSIVGGAQPPATYNKQEAAGKQLPAENMVDKKDSEANIKNVISPADTPHPGPIELHRGDVFCETSEGPCFSYVPAYILIRHQL